MAIEAYSLARDGEKQLSANFKVREFYCRDGSDPIFVDSELVQCLQKIRNHFGKPVHITSGYRTAAYNARKDVGGAKFSQHQYGKAADIWIDGVSVDTLANYIDQSVLLNTGGIGRYYKDAAQPTRKQPFVHIDVRKARSRWLG